MAIDVIAHRGFAGEYPENTVTAFEKASYCCDALECDVRRCDSGELVVIHDETVDRVTNKTGLVAEYTKHELKDLSVHGTEEGVPTLTAVLETVPADMPVIVELKECGLAADVQSHNDTLQKNIRISSFSHASLREAMENARDIPRAFLCRSPEHSIETAVSLGCTAVHPHYAMCTHQFTQSAKTAGMSVVPWTVNSKQTARTLKAIGVHGVITDSPRILTSDTNNGNQ